VRCWPVAVCASGETVFVTGSSLLKGTSYASYVTVAYDAATGAQLWAARYNGSTTRARQLRSSHCNLTIDNGQHRLSANLPTSKRGHIRNSLAGAPWLTSMRAGR